MKATIFNIQRYSTDDGPGIRTTVFFSGCFLHCLWCSNPESQSNRPQVAHNNSLCTRCGRCIDACSLQAIALSDNGVTIDRKSCNHCEACIVVCADRALKIFGKQISSAEIIDEVSKDAMYYWNSGGGVTVSGGEPMVQAIFVGEFLKHCKQLGFNTALDTSGYFNLTEEEEVVLAHSDLVLFDLKHMDSYRHKEITGVPNELILENAKKIAAKSIPMIIRIPLIPDINDSEDQIRYTAAFATGLPSVTEVNLLPYHRFGESKYEMLDRMYELRKLESPHAQHLAQLKNIVNSFGLKCEIA